MIKNEVSGIYTKTGGQLQGESEMDSDIYSSGERGETTPGTSVLREGRFKMTGKWEISHEKLKLLFFEKLLEKENQNHIKSSGIEKKWQKECW